MTGRGVGMSDAITSGPNALADALLQRDRLRSRVRQLEAELAESERRLAVASEVYCEITGGLLSKTGYPAETILTYYREDVDKFVREETRHLQERLDRVHALVARSRVGSGLVDLSDIEDALAGEDR